MAGVWRRRAGRPGQAVGQDTRLGGGRAASPGSPSCWQDTGSIELCQDRARPVWSSLAELWPSAPGPLPRATGARTPCPTRRFAPSTSATMVRATARRGPYWRPDPSLCPVRCPPAGVASQPGMQEVPAPLLTRTSPPGQLGCHLPRLIGTPHSPGDPKPCSQAW